MDKILALIGATGRKSGGGISQILNAHKDEVLKQFPGGVRVLVRATSNTSYIDSADLKFEKFIGDIQDEAFLLKALAGVDTLLHIAGIKFSPKIVRAAIKSGVSRLILVHTTGIYSKYKAAGEEYRNIDSYICKACKKTGMQLTILRPTMIYGNTSDNNVAKFIKIVDKLPIMPVVNGARYELQPVHYMDLSEAYYQVIMSEETTVNHDFNLSGGEEIELRTMLEVIGERLGKRVRFFSVPFPIAYAGAWVIYIFTAKKRDYREKVQRLCEPRVYSHEEATAAFGYHPRTFREGVISEVEEYKKQRH